MGIYRNVLLGDNSLLLNQSVPVQKWSCQQVVFGLMLLAKNSLIPPHISYGNCDWPVLMSVKLGSEVAGAGKNVLLA